MGKVRDALLGLAIGARHTNKINQRDRFFDSIIHLNKKMSFEIWFMPYKMSKVTGTFELDKTYAGCVQGKEALVTLRDQIRSAGLLVDGENDKKTIFLSTIDYYFTIMNLYSKAEVTVSKQEMDAYSYKLDYYMNGGDTESTAEIDAFSIVEGIMDKVDRMIKMQKNI